MINEETIERIEAWPHDVPNFGQGPSGTDWESFWSRGPLTGKFRALPGALRSTNVGTNAHWLMDKYQIILTTASFEVYSTDEYPNYRHVGSLALTPDRDELLAAFRMLVALQEVGP